MYAGFEMARRLTPTPRKRRHRPRQLELRPRTWGGRREGAGRPSLGRVPRVVRPPVASRFPVHVTLKLDESLPNLRTQQLFRVIELCLRQGKEREGFRLVHYSVQGHHLHLIVEAQSAQDLGAGIKGLSVRIARRLNATLGRTGRVFVDRYFARVLKTPRETRAALAYVLLNARRHASQRGQKLARSWVDPCSSGGVLRRVARPAGHAARRRATDGGRAAHVALESRLASLALDPNRRDPRLRALTIARIAPAGAARAASP